ncbi:sigma-54-dependent transcriptional regulator [Parahaliea mediterranea]|uniref:sigma-54-dependent transcriptional regulator n=1 Tax=Parahaliea mediterranea TaxID=651086 RepID=UPI00130094D2|nr:sigma-54 dependent transcriptional regulator [Parahaliea mediterranea]
MNAHCLVVDGDEAASEALATLARDAGFQTYRVKSVADAKTVLAGKTIDVLFAALDLPGGDSGLQLLSLPQVADTETIVLAEADDPERADLAVRQGAAWFLCKPFDNDYVSALLGDIAAECADSGAGVGEDVTAQVVDQFGFLRGSSRPMRKLYRQLRKVAASEASVLVFGESGTGKELVARTVHTLSERREGPFVAVNCAAVAENLMESELFGHEKGSFSGAERRHHGFFERASGGTLLLDEITELDLELQAKLLRVLETRLVRRVGSEQELPVDVRVVSATNRQPEDAVSDGRLREDLYYRLAQVPLQLPPLRRRGNDIGGLAQFFLNELNAHHGTELRYSASALERIAGHRWPGNVRQLKHAVERAYILSEAVIEADVFETELATAAADDDANSVEIPIGTSLADSEREIILATLARHDGDKAAAAEVLGISLKTLYNRLKRYEG